jgi:hypothetical protein
MSLNTLETAYVNGQVIDASHINELTLSLLGQLVGRDSEGIPTPGQSLGTLAIPWGNLYATGIILDGLALDVSSITSLPNRIVSGATRSLSSLPDFLRADGAALAFDILGATTDLVLSINNTATTISSDLNKTGVTAAPSTNNTCDVNDTNISSDIYAGEKGEAIEEITIDAVGSEISSRVGQIAAFQTPAGEIFQALIKNATTLTNVFRGFYFDDGGDPISRDVLSNNDTLTLLNIGWVFVEDNGTTVDISYITPVVAYSSPNSPSTGDYWFDISNQVWKRYSGVSWEIINRILIGQVVSDDTNTIASRCEDFSNPYSDFNNAVIEVFSSEIVKIKDTSHRVNVYGTEVLIDLTKTDFNITTDLETGLTEASDTLYYLYLSDQGQAIISDEKPYYRADLKGHYHPYHSYRCIGEVYNDSSSDLDWYRNSRYSNYIPKDTSSIDLDTHNGYGAVSTFINRYSNITSSKNHGAYFDYVDTVNEGTEITIKRRCKIHINVSHGTNQASGSGAIGVSKNSTQLTTDISLINASDRKCFMSFSGSADNLGMEASTSIEVEAGDIIRPHGRNVAPTTAGLSQFHILATAID